MKIGNAQADKVHFYRALFAVSISFFYFGTGLKNVVRQIGK